MYVYIYIYSQHISIFCKLKLIVTDGQRMEKDGEGESERKGQRKEEKHHEGIDPFFGGDI